MTALHARPRMNDSLLTRLSILIGIANPDDAISWERFYARYQSVVIAYCQSKGLNREDANDVSQRVFIQIAEDIGGFQHTGKPGSFRSWLFQATRWRIVDLFRKKNPAAPGDDLDDEHPAPSDTDEVWQTEWKKAWLARALEELCKRVKPHQYQAFVQVELEGMDPADVARFHGVSRTTVYIWSHRFRRHLRQIMDKFDRANKWL
jgi:RNA polymerase sigma factor (sigma-70 family)